MKFDHPLTLALTLLAAGGLGWFAHTPSTVRAAAEAGPVSFQLQGAGPATQLGIYFGTERDLYVYQGVTAGSSLVNCSYKLHISRPGAPVERSNCGVGNLN